MESLGFGVFSRGAWGASGAFKGISSDGFEFSVEKDCFSSEFSKKWLEKSRISCSPERFSNLSMMLLIMKLFFDCRRELRRVCGRHWCLLESSIILIFD